jgi:hypothetical protein
MAEQGIYGDTPDGVERYDAASFIAFGKTRPLLSGILGAELAVGLLLGLWALAQLHIFGLVFGLVLTALGVPALRFAVYSKDPKFRSGTGSCGPQCSCSPMCCGAGAIEGFVVFFSVVLLFVKFQCSGGPWPCSTVDCLGGVSTTTAFPTACTGNGYQVGCTRLVPVAEVTGPHRVVCASDCNNSSYCIKADASRSWCNSDYTMIPVLLPRTASVDDVSRFVDASLDGTWSDCFAMLALLAREYLLSA